MPNTVYFNVHIFCDLIDFHEVESLSNHRRIQAPSGLLKSWLANMLSQNTVFVLRMLFRNFLHPASHEIYESLIPLMLFFEPSILSYEIIHIVLLVSSSLLHILPNRFPQVCFSVVVLESFLDLCVALFECLCLLPQLLDILIFLFECLLVLRQLLLLVAKHLCELCVALREFAIGFLRLLQLRLQELFAVLKL